MVTGGRLALPEPLHDENAQSWFKRFGSKWLGCREATAASPYTILGGHAWVIFDSLGDGDTDTYCWDQGNDWGRILTQQAGNAPGRK